MIAKIIALKHETYLKDGIILGLIVALLAYIGSINYLLFHSIIELLVVFISFGIFVISIHTKGKGENNFITYLGICSGFIGIIGLLHVLTYKGMGVFPEYSPNVSTQLWIISRYFFSISLFMSPWVIKRRINTQVSIFCYCIITIYLLLSVFYFKNFPACYVDGLGLTQFKKVSEYIISFLFTIDLLLIWEAREYFSPKNQINLILMLVLSIGAELLFTSYANVYGQTNMAGHILVFLSYCLIYRTVIETNLIEPNNMMYYSLQEQINNRKNTELELKRVNRVLKALSDSNEALIYALDETQLLNKICSIIVEVGGYCMAWIGYIHQEEGKKVTPVAQAGFEEGYLKDIIITWDDSPHGQGPTGMAIKSGKPVVVRNMKEDPSCRPWCNDALKRGYQSSIAIPLVVYQRTMGCLNIYAKELNTFDEQETDLLTKLAHNVAYGIKTRRDQEKVVYMGTHDKLTGLHNRAFGEEAIQRLDIPEMLPVSVIMGDINGLKFVNDVFGHRQGDGYIVDIACILQDVVREEDVVARWGGDEYVIIMPKTTADEAMMVCKQIAAVCQNRVKEPTNLSIALGYATKKDAETSIDHIIKEAEDWMYRDKLLNTMSSRNETLSLLQKSLFEKNIETEEHAARLKELSVKLGMRLGLTTNELNDLSLYGLLHDIGKIAVSEAILTKPGKLASEEWTEIKRHSEIGYRIVATSNHMTHIAEYILCHHERWDGTGYPRGLSGEEIPLFSRIMSVVDAYDVITHSRPYKKAVDHDSAMKEIGRCAGTQFDPRIVEQFVKLMNDAR